MLGSSSVGSSACLLNKRSCDRDAPPEPSFFDFDFNGSLDGQKIENVASAIRQTKYNRIGLMVWAMYGRNITKKQTLDLLGNLKQDILYNFNTIEEDRNFYRSNKVPIVCDILMLEKKERAL